MNIRRAAPLIVIAFILLAAGAAFWYTERPAQETFPLPLEGPIQIIGTMECLPHKDQSGPQTTECAFGLMDDAGHHFALKDTDPNYKNLSSVPSTARVAIDGTFTKQEDEKYLSVGVIAVEHVSLADVPTRETLSGTFMCLPHKDQSGPQTEECAFGIKADDGKYYAIDFSLLSQEIPDIASGNRISASGLLVPVEQLSTTFWQQYPIVGIFSVTDSLTIEEEAR